MKSMHNLKLMIRSFLAVGVLCICVSLQAQISTTYSLRHHAITFKSDRAEIVESMMELAIEELNHFREVVKIMTSRGVQLAPDEKDSYVNDFRSAFRKGSDVYMLDRLLVGGIIEARGCERFGLVGEALDAGPLKDFYLAITASEDKHKDLFVELALKYFDEDVVYQRLDELLDFEAKIVEALPFRAALH